MIHEETKRCNQISLCRTPKSHSRVSTDQFNQFYCLLQLLFNFKVFIFIVYDFQRFIYPCQYYNILYASFSFLSYYCVVINDEICYLSIYIFTCISPKVIYFGDRRNKEKGDSFRELFRYAGKMITKHQNQAPANYNLADHSIQQMAVCFPCLH